MLKLLDAPPDHQREIAAGAAQRVLLNPDTDMVASRPVGRRVGDDVVSVVRSAVVAGHRLRIHYSARRRSRRGERSTRSVSSQSVTGLICSPRTAARTAPTGCRGCSQPRNSPKRPNAPTTSISMMCGVNVASSSSTSGPFVLRGGSAQRRIRQCGLAVHPRQMKTQTGGGTSRRPTTSTATSARVRPSGSRLSGRMPCRRAHTPGWSTTSTTVSPGGCSRCTSPRPGCRFPASASSPPSTPQLGAAGGSARGDRQHGGREVHAEHRPRAPSLASLSLTATLLRGPGRSRDAADPCAVDKFGEFGSDGGLLDQVMANPVDGVGRDGPSQQHPPPTH